jgi:hypothetical protein
MVRMTSAAILQPRTESKAEIANRIRMLAREHGVAFEGTPLDRWAGQITRLAGDAVDLDPIEDLLTALVRAGVMTSRDATILQGAYLGAR